MSRLVRCCRSCVGLHRSWQGSFGWWKKSCFLEPSRRIKRRRPRAAGGATTGRTAEHSPGIGARTERARIAGFSPCPLQPGEGGYASERDGFRRQRPPADPPGTRQPSYATQAEPAGRARGSRRSAALVRLAPPCGSRPACERHATPGGGLPPVVERSGRTERKASTAKGASASGDVPVPAPAGRHRDLGQSLDSTENRASTRDQWKPHRLSPRALCVRHEPMSGAEFAEPGLTGSRPASARRVRPAFCPRRVRSAPRGGAFAPRMSGCPSKAACRRRVSGTPTLLPPAGADLGRRRCLAALLSRGFRGVLPTILYAGKTASARATHVRHAPHLGLLRCASTLDGLHQRQGRWRLFDQLGTPQRGESQVQGGWPAPGKRLSQERRCLCRARCLHPGFPSGNWAIEPWQGLWCARRPRFSGRNPLSGCASRKRRADNPPLSTSRSCLCSQ